MKRLTHKEILEIYHAGPEKVIELVDALFEVIEKKLSEQIQQLQIRVKTLEERLAKDSHNSNKPLFTDRFVKPRSQRPKGERQTGGQIDTFRSSRGGDVFYRIEVIFLRLEKTVIP